MSKWSPHSVELAIWTHCVVSELQPDLLEGDSPTNGSTADTANPAAPTPTTPLETSDESNLEPPHLTNGMYYFQSCFSIKYFYVFNDFVYFQEK